MAATVNQEKLDRTFAALANSTRRSLLARLAEGEATVNQLAEPFAMKLPAISKHIKILQQAGLVQSFKRAQYRVCALNPSALDEVSNWSMQCRMTWESRFDRLDSYLAQIQAEDTKGEKP